MVGFNFFKHNSAVNLINQKMRNLGNFVNLCKCKNWRNFSYSAYLHAAFSVEDVRIPIPSSDESSTRHLAGKLWQSKLNPGSNATPIICMHGAQDNCGSFDSLIPLLIQENSPIFALDLPGHGWSYQTKELCYYYHLDGLLSIQRTLKHFNWDKATLLGHSLGAMISFIFCAAFPEKVHRYIALDNIRPPPATDLTPAFQGGVKTCLEIEEKVYPTKERRKQRPLYTYQELLMKTYEHRKGIVSLDGCKLLLARGAEKVVVDGNERYRFSHDLKIHIKTLGFGLFTEEQTECMATRIGMKVCVIKGDPGTEYEPTETYLKLVDIMRQSAEHLEFHLVPGSHHFHLNSPELVAPIVNKFLAI